MDRRAKRASLRRLDEGRRFVTRDAERDLKLQGSAPSTSTQEGLMQGGLAILGMTLRAISYGASQGFSEWGDNRAFQPLLDFAEDTREHEEARTAACAAPRVGHAKARRHGQDRAARRSRSSARAIPRTSSAGAACSRRSSTGPCKALRPRCFSFSHRLLTMQTRHQAARAIGKAGLDADTQAEALRLDERTNSSPSMRRLR